ncbi:hypothetical protein RUND412_000915 [Rhizina undulata]
MDITFITMHDLSADARMLYASDSISDVLGYNPQEVIGKSCFEYFHPDEMPFARSIHGRGVHLDKAAVLSYCKLKRRNGEYVCCECVFTVVYSVIVASTSLYRHNNKSHGRAIAAPVIRRVFSSSQNDPRYHMLTHLSSKFSAPPSGQHEPRAALILNRFTRTLTILYATHALGDILNFPPEEAIGKSFFECIQENCLQEAVDALERAKENDSIAYLRFHWRDPRPPVRQRRRQSTPHSRSNNRYSGMDVMEVDNLTGSPVNGSSANRGYDDIYAHRDDMENDRVQDYDDEHEYSNRSANSQPGLSSRHAPDPVVEVEAVVSCTSDGLVVVLRRARPIIHEDPRFPHLNAGLFASPWAALPLIPPPQQAVPHNISGVPGGPEAADFMDSIRQVAVFAWSLRSINASLLQYALRPERPEANDHRLMSPKPRNGSSNDIAPVVSDAYVGHEVNMADGRRINHYAQNSTPPPPPQTSTTTTNGYWPSNGEGSNRAGSSNEMV